ncbi:MAG: acyl-[Elusimicrobiaceae bacterium]|nr:acyl-[ACP]--phospholipid O-acyltransferase [Elusimicrobiaceae bacterium]
MLSLLKTFFSRAFFALFCTQYLGAFNDNFFRTAMATFITYKVTTMSPDHKSVIVSLAVALFMLPFFLFSALAGELADKFRKDILIKATKVLEVIIVLLAAVGFLTTNVPMLLGVLFLMGTQSSFFGPVKYSILPDILKENQLIAGNGIIEAGTYAAILQGTIFGGIIIAANEFLLPGIMLAVAIVGVGSSLLIPAQKPANAALKVDTNFLRSTWKNMKFAKQNHDIFLCILGISWFWLLGTALVAQMPSLAHDILNGTPGLFTFLLTLFSCGIGVGSLLCQFLVKGEITSKYVPISALVMTLFLADLACATSGYVTSATAVDYKAFLLTFAGKRITLDLLGFAVCGGLYIVPLNAMLQALAGEDVRSRVIATNNIINALFMVMGSGFCALLLAMHFTIPTVFSVIAFANALAAVYICGLLPHHIVRMILTRVLNFVYGVKVNGLEHWKNLKGNVLIIANHTSFLDAALLWVYLPDNLYFAIDTYVSQKWWVRPFLHLVKYFPIDPTNPMAVKSIIEEVKSGKRVVIFPEGRITTTGGLMKIYPGPALIADKSDAQLLPVYLEGSQYSVFSRFGSQFKTRPHSKITITIQAPTQLNIDESIHGKARRLAASRAVYDLMVKMKYEAGEIEETLFDSLLDTMDLVGRNKRAINDVTRHPLTYGQFVTAAFVLGKQIAKEQKSGEMTGLLMPNMTASAVAFFGMRAFNITPCMLNFSTGVKNMLACCKAAKISTVVTSKLFLRQGGLQETAHALKQAGLKLIYLEDLKKQITLWDKLVGWAASYFPRRYYKLIRGNVTSKDPAVVLFTSGSEGTPKGVVLTHENIQANRLQLLSVLDLGVKDRMFNAMPIFHSFGLTGGMLLPLLSGVPVFFYPSPLHYRVVPEMIYNRNATIVFGTDTFFNGYAKMAHPYDFYSVRLAVVGAEKLKEETIRKYYDQFGLRILEGYGATETSPVMAVDTPMYFKRGSVGRFLPGIEYKLEQIPGVEEGGKLWVKGANIMAGYLRESNPGVIEPPQDGWYDTGDIVRVDEDGFVFILGRAKRFAKIAGEMISLTAVEMEINALWPGKMNAVINIPDEKKGEQLVLFTTQPDADRAVLITNFKEKGLSELAVPKTIRVVDEIPLMGTGKVDYVKLKEMALS